MISQRSREPSGGTREPWQHGTGGGRADKGLTRGKEELHVGGSGSGPVKMALVLNVLKKIFIREVWLFSGIKWISSTSGFQVNRETVHTYRILIVFS